MKLKNIVLIAIVLILIMIVWRQFRPIYTPKIVDKTGTPLPNSISLLEEAPIGNMQQWVQIRGNDAENPVLLWLHGGPGSAQMPIYSYTRNLEEEFIVVHWDQRGAGKSNPSNFVESTMTLVRFVSDAHELTQYLKDKFHKDKIYIIGHSWGTMLGITLCKKYPQDYYAYIGMSQVVNNKKAQQLAYEWIYARASKRDREALTKLGNPPYLDHEKFVKFIHLVDVYGGGMDAGMLELAITALPSHEYRLSDFGRWLDGANRGSGPMWEAYNAWNVFEYVPQVEILVHFLSGINDYNTPTELVREYWDFLIAPQGKSIVTFDRSAHTPFIKQADALRAELVKVKKQTYHTQP